MRRAALATAGLFLATGLHLGEADGNLWWNAANGFGFVACVLMLTVALLGGRAPPIGAGLVFHRHFGWAAFAALGIHVAMMLADQTTWQYLEIGAPAYMWAGLMALVPLTLLAVSGLQGPRRRWFGRAGEFRSAHLLWSAAAAALVSWHVIGSGYYVEGLAAAAIFGAVFMGVPVYAQLRRSAVRASPHPRWPYVVAGAFLLAFMAARMTR